MTSLSTAKSSDLQQQQQQQQQQQLSPGPFADLISLPLDSAIDIVARSVTQSFSKPAPDRERLYGAVVAIVSGAMTIKEASMAFQFATSTMHPYVHRARASLGDRAPAVKVSRPSSTSSKQRKGVTTPSSTSSTDSGNCNTQQQPATSSSSKPDNDAVATSSSNSAFSAFRPLANGCSGTNGENTGAIDLSMRTKDNQTDALLETIRDAVRLEVGAAVDAATRDRLVDEVYRLVVVSGCGVQNGTEKLGSISPQLVNSCVQKARLLIASPSSVGAPKTAALTNGTKSASNTNPVVVHKSKQQSSPVLPNDSFVAQPSWLQCPQAVETAIWAAMQGCQYVNSQKKDRLCAAVLEVITGQKTITAASQSYDVPFTTLQTYCRRAKINLHVALGQPIDDFIEPGEVISTVPAPSVKPVHTASAAHKRKSQNIEKSPSQNAKRPAMHKPTSVSVPTSTAALRVSANLQSCTNGNNNNNNSNGGGLFPDLSTSAALLHLQQQQQQQQLLLLQQQQQQQQQQKLLQPLPVFPNGHNNNNNNNPVFDANAMLQFLALATAAAQYSNLANMGSINSMGALSSPQSNCIAPVPPPTATTAPLLGIGGGIFGNHLPTGEDCFSAAQSGNNNNINSNNNGFTKIESVTSPPEEQWENCSPVKLLASNGGGDDDDDDENLVDVVNGDSETEDGTTAIRGASIFTAQQGKESSVEPAPVGGSPGPQAGGGTPVSAAPDNDLAAVNELVKSAERDDKGEIVMTNELAVDRTVLNSHFEGENRDRLKWAVLDSLDGTSSVKEASQEYMVPFATVNTFYLRARNMVDMVVRQGQKPETVLQTGGISSSTARSDRRKKIECSGGQKQLLPQPTIAQHGQTSQFSMAGGASATGGEGKKSAKKSCGPSSGGAAAMATAAGSAGAGTTAVAGKPLDPADRERIAQIEAAVEDVCKSSLYPAPQKDKLREAVMLVIKGELTINAAANVKQLPSSTVHPYVHRARTALGDNLPPQATGPTNWGGVSKKNAKEGNTNPIVDSLLGQSDSPLSSKAVLACSSTEDSPSPAPSTSSSKSANLSAKAVLRAARQSMAVDHNKHNDGKKVDLEEADRVITELVKNSLYDGPGRQRLYEAVFMVVTDNTTTSEAARSYHIPPSTIQPYVQRARAALGLPIYSTGTTSSHAGAVAIAAAQAAAKQLPVVSATRSYAKPGEEASCDEIVAAVREVVSSCNADETRKEKITEAVAAAVSGRLTIKDACSPHSLPASTVHPYVSRARNILGAKCPSPKVSTLAPSTTSNSSGANSPAPSLSGDEDGQVPTTVKGAAQLFGKKGNMESAIVVDFTNRDELQGELTKILNRYNFRGDRVKMIDAVSTVIGDNKTLAEVSHTMNLAQTTLSTYVRLAKLFLKPSNGDEAEASNAEEAAVVATSTEHSVVEPASAAPDVVSDSSDIRIQTNSDADNPSAVKPESTTAGGGENTFSSTNGDSGCNDDNAGNDSTAEGNGHSGSTAGPSFSYAGRESEQPQGAVAGKTSNSSSFGQKYMELVALFRPETEDCAKIQLIASHIISTQYKRGLVAQKRLLDAVAEALQTEGDANHEEILAKHPGLSTNILSIYSKRVRDVMQCFDQEALRQFYSTAEGSERQSENADTADAAETSARSDASGGSFRPFSPTTRSSRRLQEKCSPTVDVVIMNGKQQQQLPAEFEAAMADFVRKLESCNFTVAPKFGYAMRAALLEEDDSGRASACPADSAPRRPKSDQEWSSWWTAFRKRNGLAK